MNAHAQYLALEKARHEFEAEAIALLAIARAAGDDLDTAISWASDDHVIGQLFDKLEAARKAA